MGRKVKEDFIAAFEWGSWHENEFIFKGVRFRHSPVKGECKLDMEEYCSALAWPSLREVQDGPLPKKFYGDYRSCNGSLQWGEEGAFGHAVAYMRAHVCTHNIMYKGMSPNTM